MKSALNMESALELLMAHTQHNTIEQVGIADACGRVCGQDIKAVMDQPPFDRSPLDGYGVRAEDIASASRDNGVRLKISIEVHAGSVCNDPLQPGHAARLLTGAKLPEGVDCVVRQESTKREQDHVYIYANPGKDGNIVRKGEDLRIGMNIIHRGQVLEYTHIGVLAGQGFSRLPVYTRPRIGLASTGDELVEVGNPLGAGQIYESNSLMMAARVKDLGGMAFLHKSVSDDPDRIHSVLLDLLNSNDMVITTGGASVGDRDFMPIMGEMLGAQPLFSMLDHKPGGHVLGWVADGKLLLCLSGNPFAAMVAFELLAVPAIKRMGGAAVYTHRRLEGRLADGFTKCSHMRRFIRARMENGIVTLPGKHASGCLSTLMGCNCLVDIPAGSPGLAAGQSVSVISFL